MNEKNLINTWQQGQFIDQSQYRHTSAKQKQKWNEQEKHLVRPAPLENAICHCADPEDAVWIADRLNLAAEVVKIVEKWKEGMLTPHKFVDKVVDEISSKEKLDREKSTSVFVWHSLYQGKVPSPHNDVFKTNTIRKEEESQ